MSEATKELLWMTGCTTVMICVGLIALAGYLRQKNSPGQSDERSDV